MSERECYESASMCILRGSRDIDERGQDEVDREPKAKSEDGEDGEDEASEE